MTSKTYEAIANEIQEQASYLETATIAKITEALVNDSIANDYKLTYSVIKSKVAVAVAKYSKWLQS